MTPFRPGCKPPPGTAHRSDLPRRRMRPGQHGHRPPTPVTGVLVETLLNRGAESDVAEAETAIERLAEAPSDEGVDVRDIWLLRLRALLARARGDEVAYRDYRDRYSDMATSLGFEGHMAMAEAMT